MRSIIVEIAKHGTINSCIEVITENIKLSSDDLNLIRVSLAMAWIDGAHLALCVPSYVCKKLSGSQEVYDLATDTIKQIAEEIIDKVAPDAQGKERAELIAFAIETEKWKPIINLLKKDRQGFSFFLNEN